MREGIRFIEVIDENDGNVLIGEIQQCMPSYDYPIQITQSIDDPTILMYWITIFEVPNDCISEYLWDNSVPYKEGILI